MAGQIDRYPNTEAVSSPARRWAVITPHDTNLLAEVPKFLVIGHDGAAGPAASNLVLEGSDGNKCTFRVSPGTTLDVRPQRVWSTGSTAGVVVIGMY